MDNYLVLDGKKYELSSELVNALRSIGPVPEKKNPFERTIDDKAYFFINENGKVKAAIDRHFSVDDACFETANYCCDKELMEQRAMHETLNRLLWRYSEEHGGDDANWDGHAHFYIYLVKNRNEFEVSTNDNFCTQGVVYFKDAPTAADAIEEVIAPFIDAHPDFVW